MPKKDYNPKGFISQNFPTWHLRIVEDQPSAIIYLRSGWKISDEFYQWLEENEPGSIFWLTDFDLPQMWVIPPK